MQPSSTQDVSRLHGPVRHLPTASLSGRLVLLMIPVLSHSLLSVGSVTMLKLQNTGGLLVDGPKINPPAPVGAKGRVFPEALATGSFSWGGPFYAGKTHGTFIKHCNLQHFGPPLFGPRTLRQRL